MADCRIVLAVRRRLKRPDRTLPPGVVLKIEALPRSELEEQVRRSLILEQDGHGIKVLALPDGRYLKYFRRKRRFNRELWAPAAVRFARHARRLKRMGVASVSVQQLYRLTGEPHTVAVYHPLPGDTLRERLARGRLEREEARALGAFLAGLHQRGILFRSVHPGNIILMPDGGFGLIDVLDLRFWPWALQGRQRRRNWRHFMRCAEDRVHWTEPLLEAVLEGYGDREAGSDRQRRRRRALLWRLWTQGGEP